METAGNLTRINLAARRRMERSANRKMAKKMKYFYLLLLLPFIHQLVFSYAPIYGVILSFKEFSFSRGILGSEWNNFENFKMIFKDPFFWRILRNTLRLSILGILISPPCTITFALLLNELDRMLFKRVVQTISYLPHFLSWVVIATFIYQILSPENGFFNAFLMKLGIVEEPIYFMALKEWFIPIYLLSGLWAGIGWGSIIYLSAIAGIDVSQYESAELDGANRFQRAIYITLPGIMPTFTVLLILSLGSILHTSFDHVFNLYNELTYEVADVISTYVFRRGLLEAKYAYAAAVGLFQNVVGFILVMIVNSFVRRHSDYTLI